MLCSSPDEFRSSNRSYSNNNNSNNSNNNMQNNQMLRVHSKIKNHCLREIKGNGLEGYPLQRFCHDVLKFVEIEGVELSEMSKQILYDYGAEEYSEQLISVGDMDLFFQSLESTSLSTDENSIKMEDKINNDSNQNNIDENNDIEDTDCIQGFGIKSSPTREILGQSPEKYQCPPDQSPLYKSQFSPISEVSKYSKAIIVTPSRETSILNDTISHLERELLEERQKNVDCMDSLKKLRKENTCLSQVSEGLEEECMKLMQINKLQEEEIESLRSKLVSLKSEAKSVEPEKKDCCTQTDHQEVVDPLLDTEENDLGETAEQVLNKADDNLDLLYDSTVSVMNVRDKLLKFMNHNTSVSHNAAACTPLPPPEYGDLEILTSQTTPSGKTADTSIVSMSGVWDEQISLRDAEISKLKDIVEIQQEMLDRKKMGVEESQSKYYASIAIQCELNEKSVAQVSSRKSSNRQATKSNRKTIWGEFNFAFYSLFMWILGIVLAVIVLKIDSLGGGELWNHNLVLIG